MSDAISRRIKQLENQNTKLKKLLESTLQITSEDTAKCLQLQTEADFLKKVVSDLENQKKQLEDELNLYAVQDICQDTTKSEVDIQTTLNNALNDIQRESTEIEQLKTEDEHLQSVISDLENEKQKLLANIRLVKKANEEHNALAQENLKLRQELALLEAQSSPNVSSYSGQDLINKLASIENLKQRLQADIITAKQTPDILGIPVENTVLELKISGLEKQKETVLRNLKANLLLAATEISLLHSNTSDDQLRRLLNELDIHKTILMMNLNDLKQMYNAEENEKDNVFFNEHQEINIQTFLNSDEVPKPSSSFSSDSSEDVKEPSEDLSFCDQIIHDLLPTVCEEDESQNDLLAETEQLIEDINRLEHEREELIQQIESVNTQRFRENECPQDEVQKLSLDDATIQMYSNQEQLLAQRIRELEDDNERIRRNLTTLLEETQNDKDDLTVLEQGEKLIRDHQKGGVGDDMETK